MKREPRGEPVVNSEAVTVVEDRILVERGAVRVLHAGTGSALVYLHGVADSGEFLPVLKRLSMEHTVIRPDHPGFLKSEDCAVESVADVAAVHRELLEKIEMGNGPGERIPRAATDLAEAIEEEDRGIILVGCSLGGWVAVELALLIPEKIAALCLIDPAGLPGPSGELAPNVFTMTPEETLRATIADPIMREAAAAQVPTEATRLRLARNRETARRLAGDPYMHDPTLARRAAKLSMPVHIIWGEQDGIIPASFTDSWARMWPHAQVTIIPDAGHLPHVERTEAFLGALAQVGTLPDAVQDGTSKEGVAAWN